MNALEKLIREMIAAQGPISIAAYMELALQHPVYGYYRTRQPLGRTGDFITSPEVSQMFGEMIGVWCAEMWRGLGKPSPFALVELGPGRGTLMQDLLRATANVGGFQEAKELYLIDSNEVLRQEQRKVLGQDNPRFLDDIEQLPAIPVLAIANEFFDALPVRQFEKSFRGWTERMVTIKNDALSLILRPLPDAELGFIPGELRESLPGFVYEFSPKAQTMMRTLARLLAARKGAALVIDYGYTAFSGAPSVQAVSKHVVADVFERPGEIDLTAHVDFNALAQAAKHEGLTVSPVTGQGEFLRNWGIDIRADSLKKHAAKTQIAEIDAGLRRLTDESQMGALFKVMEIKSGGFSQ